MHQIWQHLVLSFPVREKKEKKPIELLRFKSGKISVYGYKFVQFVNCLI